MKPKHFFLTFAVLWCFAFGFSQDSIPKTKEIKSPEKVPVSEEVTYETDSLLDSKKVIKANIKPELDSLAIRNLQDNDVAAAFDQNG